MLQSAPARIKPSPHPRHDGGDSTYGACPPLAILTKLRCNASQEGLDGSFMVNIHSGKRLWQPAVSDWDFLEWDIEPFPNLKGTWYHVPGSHRWVHFITITQRITPVVLPCRTPLSWCRRESYHNAMQQAQQDCIYTNQCNWAILFVPSMSSDHGSETVMYEITTLPLYPKKSERFLPSLPLHGMAQALYLTFF
jgi:hypothetical protein